MATFTFFSCTHPISQEQKVNARKPAQNYNNRILLPLIFFCFFFEHNVLTQKLKIFRETKILLCMPMNAGKIVSEHLAQSCFSKSSSTLNSRISILSFLAAALPPARHLGPSRRSKLRISPISLTNHLLSSKELHGGGGGGGETGSMNHGRLKRNYKNLAFPILALTPRARPKSPLRSAILQATCASCSPMHQNRGRYSPCRSSVGASSFIWPGDHFRRPCVQEKSPPKPRSGNQR